MPIAIWIKACSYQAAQQVNAPRPPTLTTLFPLISSSCAEFGWPHHAQHTAENYNAFFSTQSYGQKALTPALPITAFTINNLGQQLRLDSIMYG
jgi:hypothetical protein